MVRNNLEGKLTRPVWAEIDLAALSNNLDVVRKAVGKGVDILGVVKADAYGHGLVPVSRVLVRKGVRMLGITLVEEAIALRKAGITVPVLFLGGYSVDEMELLLEQDITLAVHDVSVYPVLERFAKKKQKPVSVHLKVDTGMGRLGIPFRDVRSAFQALERFKGIHVTGLMTHYADAEAENRGFADEQTRRFRNVIEEVVKHRTESVICHAANSAAILTDPASHFHMVRPGIMLYGYLPPPMSGLANGLKPVLQLKTRIVHLKRVSRQTPISYGRTWEAPENTLVATLPIGYADGYPRYLSNRGHVLYRGNRLPIAGRICMDLFMVDMRGVERAQVGDEIVLIGEDGKERVTADDIAEITHTISYEVLCGISKRIPRVYVQPEIGVLPESSHGKQEN